MITIKSRICIGKFIGSPEIGISFFSILEKHGFAPDKIGFYEPVRTPYSLEGAVKMWSDTRRFKTRIAGGMLGKKKQPNFSLMVDWSKGLNLRPDYITLYFSKTTFKAYKQTIEIIHREIFDLVEGVYGYMTHETPEKRQHVAGTLESRMPGVFYCNFFGQPYVEFFGRDKILSGPWVKTETLDNGTIVTYLSDDPNDKALVDSNDLEMTAQHHLGIDSFGDPLWKGEHMLDRQIKNVPKLILPTIRVSIDN